MWRRLGHSSEFPFGIYWETLKNLKNQNFEKMKRNCMRYHHFTHVYQKMKKAPGDVIILNLCNKKHDQMMYAYSGMECIRHNFCHFRSFFALLPHYWTQKLKFGKNVKNIFFSFWTIFCPFTPPPFITQRIKIFKKRKKTPSVSTSVP